MRKVRKSNKFTKSARLRIIAICGTYLRTAHLKIFPTNHYLPLEKGKGLKNQPQPLFGAFNVDKK
jgi:hypothetical protein